MDAVTPFPAERIKARAPLPRMFRGKVANNVVSVTVDGVLLPWRLDVANHSPGGFGWGYAGSGAAQLSVALLCEALGDVPRAIRLYQRFKFATVARWPAHRDWTISDEEIRQHCEIIEAAETARAGGM